MPAPKYGPSAVTATAVHLVKGVACRLLNIPQGRTLALPKFIATPNRAKFDLIHESLPPEKSIVEFRRELDAEVNKLIKEDIPIEVSHNMTLDDCFNEFGPDVIDRFHDINESKFHTFLNEEFRRKFGRNMYNTRHEAVGPLYERGRYKMVDGVEVDMKQALESLLSEVSGKADDFISLKTAKYVKKRRHWLRCQGLYDDDYAKASGKSDIELVLGREWTHRLGVFTMITATEWGKYFDDDGVVTGQPPPDDLRFACMNIPEVAYGWCLPNSRSRHINSWNVRDPIGYLQSTAELGRVVVTQVRFRQKASAKQVKIYLDVFPGFDQRVMGANPYVMFRENFDIKHLASVLPVTHQLHIPKMAVSKDYRNDGFSFDVRHSHRHRFPAVPSQLFEEQTEQQRAHAFPDGVPPSLRHLQQPTDTDIIAENSSTDTDSQLPLSLQN